MVDLHHIGNVDEAFAVDHRSGDRVVGATVSLPQLLCERPRIRVFARFAVDSALEGAVHCELVSEVKIPAPVTKLGADSGRVMDDSGIVKRC